MKVMMITPYFHPQIGGLELYAENVARQLAGRGHEVMVVTSGEGPAVEDYAGIQIRRLRADITVSNTPLGARWPWQLRRLMRDWRPDVINVHAPVPSMAFFAMLVAGRTPVVVTYHAGSMKKGQLLADTPIALYEAVVLPVMLWRASGIVCASEFVRGKFLARWNAKSVTATPGVDAQRFAPEPARERRGRVLFIGDFRDPRKGLEVLLAAVRQRPEVNLHVVGPGEGRAEARVEYRGVRRGDELVRELQEAEMLVLPSTTEAESFGMVLVEAMACARPVVGSRIGGIAQVVDDGVDGVLVPAGEVAAVAEAIGKLTADGRLRAKLGAAGRRKAVAQFSWALTADITESVLLEASRG